jgi:outer membrane protein assembly factor BamB
MHSCLRLFWMCVAVGMSAYAEDWSMYLHDLSHTSFNANEFILSPASVAGLVQDWRVSLGRPLAAAPTLVQGVLYFGDWDGNFYAMSAADGRIRWKQYVGKSADPPVPTCDPATGVSSQAVVLNSTVYVGGGDASLYALDAVTGNIQWRTPLADPATGAYLWSSLTALGGSLYIGIASLDDCPLARGAVVRIDISNPTQPFIRYFSTTDDPGAGLWSTPALEPAMNTLYATLGNGDLDPANGLWGDSFIAMDLSTFSTKDYLVLPSRQPDADDDWGSSPTLFTTPDGRRFVAATAKDGMLYVLNRDDMSLAWSMHLAVGCVSPELGCGSISTPATDGTLLYVGAGVVDPDGFDNGSVYAIDPVAQQVVWMHTLAGAVVAPVTLANGVVYVPTTLGAFAFDMQTGEKLWDDGGYGTVFSQIVVADGTVYTTYFEGDVVAWRLPIPPPPDPSTAGKGRGHRIPSIRYP